MGKSNLPFQKIYLRLNLENPLFLEEENKLFTE